MRKRDKICFIGPYPPPYGGMALQLREMAGRLEREGVDVSIVRTNQKIFKIFERFKGVRTFVNFLFFLRALFKELPSSTILYILGASNLYFFLCVTPSVFLGRLFKKKIYLNYRGGGPQKFFKRYKPFVSFVMRQTQITVPSEYLKNTIALFLGLKSQVIPNISYVDIFHFRQRDFLTHRVLCSRNFEKIYNVKCVVKAFRIIKNKYKDAVLGLVGEGPELKKIRRLVMELNLEDSTKFYGKLPHEKLPEIYNDYDIFLNGSDVDNFPASIIEAMASGLLVVSTNSGGIPYILKDERTGFLVNRKDYKSMADKVISAFENPKKSIEITKRAREYSERFRWENVRKVFFETVLGDLNE